MPFANAGEVQALHTVRVHSACRLWTSAFTATSGYGGKVTIVNRLVLEFSIKTHWQETVQLYHTQKQQRLLE